MKGAVRQLAKSLFAVLDWIGGLRGGNRILIYHQIGGGSSLEMEVSVDSFGRQMEWLARNYEVISLDEALANPDRGAVVLTFDDGYRSVHDVAFPVLRSHGFPFTIYLTTEPLETQVPLRDHPGAAPLTWGMVNDMLESGLLTVGAHTHTHPDLRHLASDAIKEEVARSNQIVLERTGVLPEHFTYPWGYWSEAADPIVRANYRSATVGAPLPWSRSVSDRYCIPRLPVQLSDGLRWYPSRVRGGLLFEEVIRRRLRGYTGP